MTEGTTMPAEREAKCRHCGSIAKLVCGIPCSCVGALKERDTCAYSHCEGVTETMTNMRIQLEVRGKTLVNVDGLRRIASVTM